MSGNKRGRRDTGSFEPAAIYGTRLAPWLRAGRLPEATSPAGIFWVGVLAAVAFVPLAAAVAFGSTAGLDVQLVLAVHAHATPRLGLLMRTLTDLGLIPVVTAVVIGVDLLLLRANRRLEACALTGLMLGEGAVDETLKFAIHRIRPSLFHHVALTSFSFPSGHAMATLCLLVMLLYLVWRHVGVAWRWLLLSLVLLLILGIGISRVYLGLHYPSDVVGGWLAGVAWLGAAATILRRLGSHLIRPGPTAT